jgi:MarR family transcriptional regulator, lower aerobic nicotinate degradation pathway regulator
MTETTAPPVMQRLPEELVASSLFLLKRLGMAAKEQSFCAYEELGLHPYHHAILASLDEGSHETQGAIADALGYDRGQLVGLLDDLEEAGLLERKRDPADRRRHVVRMTPAGRKTLERLRRLSAQVDDEFFSPLSPGDREQLHALLVRLAEEHLPRSRVAVPVHKK